VSSLELSLCVGLAAWDLLLLELWSILAGPVIAFWRGCCGALPAVERLAWKGSIPDEVNFSIYLILPVAPGPGVYSASNRNEYQKH
jgi:hypothetical protein